MEDVDQKGECRNWIARIESEFLALLLIIAEWQFDNNE